MGRSRAWANRVEWTVVGQYWTHTEWDSKRAGRATDANLARFVREMVDSFKPGGVNSRSGEVGGVPRVLAARVVNQRSGKVLATYTAAHKVPAPQTRDGYHGEETDPLRPDVGRCPHGVLDNTVCLNCVVLTK